MQKVFGRFLKKIFLKNFVLTLSDWNTKLGYLLKTTTILNEQADTIATELKRLMFTIETAYRAWVSICGTQNIS